MSKQSTTGTVLSHSLTTDDKDTLVKNFRTAGYDVKRKGSEIIVSKDGSEKASLLELRRGVWAYKVY